MEIRRREPVSRARFSTQVPALLQRILAARGVLEDGDCRLEAAGLHKPDSLKGLDEAVRLLETQLDAAGRILIVSDFDADGATSCALATRALHAMGFSHVDYIVPNRFEYGYGLTPEIVELAAHRHPDLLITVDNGISSVDSVKTAHARGMQVLITDHHLPGATLPAAEAIVNPNQPGCGFPGKALAGVGVVFYLMLALRARLRERGWFGGPGPDREPNMAELLDLVALGTVADVVPLERNNRILVNEGLQRIRAGRASAGILALLEIGNRRRETLVAADLGFAVAPRLNAAGRLQDMSLGIDCLLQDDPEAARRMAQELNSINETRKDIEQDMQAQALQALERDLEQAREQAGGELPAGVCLYDSDWHQGVVGLLASRLKERLHRPVIVFADAGSDDDVEQIKGSARSVRGLHVRDALASVANTHPGLLERFGGHAMAAGLTLRKTDYPRFAEAFAEVVRQSLGSEAGQACLLTDGALQPGELNLETAELIRRYGPWGQGFLEPCFDGVFEVHDQRLVGERHLKMLLAVPGSRDVLDAIAFNVDLKQWPDKGVEYLKLVYRLDVNEFRGRRNLQLMVDHLEPA